MVCACKNSNLVPAGHSSRDARCRQHCFRARVCKRNTFHADEFPHQSSDFTGDRLNRADLEPEVQLFLNRLDHKGRSVTEHAGAETHYEIDVLIAVHIPNLRTIRASRQDGIDHFLPVAVEARDGSWIGEDRPILRGNFFRLSGTRSVSCDEPFESVRLSGSNGDRRSPVEWLEWSVRFAFVFRDGCGNKRSRRRRRRGRLASHQLEELAGKQLLLLQ